MDYCPGFKPPLHLFPHSSGHDIRFSLDIGGSLVKLAYYSTVAKKKHVAQESNESQDGGLYRVVETDDTRDELRFIKFETRYMETCIDFIQQHLIGSQEFMKEKIIKVTGGGAYKYKNLLSQKLGVQVDKEDELECSIKGCNFLLKNLLDEAFFFNKFENPNYQFLKIDVDSIFPFLLVNIGSGVSFIKVTSETEFERVGGSTLGGGTFWGLGSILTNAKGFDELLLLAEHGDHRNVDMLVGDIYGGAYTSLSLPSDLIASSFGKAARSAKDKESINFRDADMARSLLVSVSNDIGQIAYLYASLYGLERIFFGGYFIRGHETTMYTITFAINFWSKGRIQAMFLRHEGYLGAIGAFLKGIEEEDSDKYCWNEPTSWVENYAGSSGLLSPIYTAPKSTMFDMLELDRFSKPLVSCPLLKDIQSYVPDTVDLTRDSEAREYWLKCFEDATEQFAERAVQSQPNKSDAEQRAIRFKEKYVSRLRHLRENPCSFGSLTVRSLLDTREQCLEEFHFADPYSLQKQQENEHALKLFSQRIQFLDQLPLRQKWVELAKGLLAGNVFDWGAKEVALLMENEILGFEEAMKKIPKQPWLVDDLELWIKRIAQQPPFKCVVFFVDNSGLDIIMGVFPFARALLAIGSKVILCANSRPVLNDVTYNELTILTKRISSLCHVLRQALSDSCLLVMESGQGSPCLDLRYIDFDLRSKMLEFNADLIILEGMGRSIHTNLHASFACDVLKVSILKNRWLAEKLGGKIFDVIFKFEQSEKPPNSDSSK